MFQLISQFIGHNYFHFQIYLFVQCRGESRLFVRGGGGGGSICLHSYFSRTEVLVFN